MTSTARERPTGIEPALSAEKARQSGLRAIGMNPNGQVKRT